MLLMSMLILADTAMPAPQNPGDLFAGLTGSCYTATMPNSAVDTHCFTASDGGKLVLDVHKVVMGGKVVYSGVTTYTPGAFAYANSLGSVMPGTASRAGDILSFTIRIGDKEQAGAWTINANGYDTEMAGAVIHYVKSGKAPEGGL